VLVVAEGKLGRYSQKRRSGESKYESSGCVRFTTSSGIYVLTYTAYIHTYIAYIHTYIAYIHTYIH